MSSTILFNVDYCLTPHRRIAHASILCEDGVITAVGGTSAFETDIASRSEGVVIHNLPDCYALPGFIDTHIHGAGGFDSSSADEGTEDITLMRRTLAGHGITSFLPTLVTRPRERFFAALRALVNVVGADGPGAEPVGLHLEGPYLNPQKRGAQDVSAIRPIDLGEAREIVTEGRGKIRIMTFAPELEDAIPLIELLRENRIIPSMGHSMADDESVTRAVDAGATHCTHLYNGMPTLHHRSVGLTAVALTDDRITIEIILDGYHIHPRMVDLACRVKPPDKIIGVSDAIQGAGLSDGAFHLDKTRIYVQDGHAMTDEGIIAGTTLTLERGWRHLVSYSRLDPSAAAACITINPARCFGIEGKGELLPGRRADIAFFDSATNKAVLTVRDGRVIYASEEITKAHAISVGGDTR